MRHNDTATVISLEYRSVKSPTTTTAIESLILLFFYA